MNEDYSSVDRVINRFYQALTFDQGCEPDYELMRSLFHPDGRITPPKEDTGGMIQPMDVSDFISIFGEKLRAEGVIASGGMEKEIERGTNVFKRVASVRSSYHFYIPSEVEPVASGVNMFQLMNDGERWWILSLTWDRAAEQ